MDKAQAIHSFWSGFLAAYDESTVPTGDDAPDYPYLTYSFADDDLGHPVSLAMSLWYRSSSWAEITEKEKTIAAVIGRGGKRIPYDDGIIWIRRGSPFAQRMSDPGDDMIRRMFFNVEVEYLSEN